MTGWTCRACANTYHDKCEVETNGVYCICTHARVGSKKVEGGIKCEICGYMMAQLGGHIWCINNRKDKDGNKGECEAYEPYLQDVRKKEG